MNINTVLDESNGVIEEIMVRFPEADQITNAVNVYRCYGEGEGIGHWMKAFAFTTTDIPSGVEAVREKYADIESSYGTRKQEVAYEDGSTWPVNSHHLLLEDESGSYLLMFNDEESGLVQTRVITPCGELR